MHKLQERLNLENIFTEIQNNHPNLKSYDAQIRALDEAAMQNWDPPATEYRTMDDALQSGFVEETK